LEKAGEKADITMPELAAELAAATCQKVDPASLSRWLIRIGYRFKKTLRASEHDRRDIKQAREEWTSTRKPIMRLEPHRVVFLDETGTTTKMTRLRGRSRKGQRLLSKAPFGHWKTQTFLAGLQCDALIAPFVIDAPMDRLIFETTSRLSWLRPSSRATSSSGTLGSYSFRSIAPTSIQSRWLLPS
jgi:hypothetical protein